jgi:hypothetical protein
MIDERDSVATVRGAPAVSDGSPSPGPLPRVSVVIPAYQAAALIDGALASVFAQSFTDYEVLVINDGSPDTAELKKVLKPFESRLRYLEQENAGPGAARNTGIREARGEWIAFLDSDDLWDPEFLREQIGYLEAHPSVDLVYADALLIGDTDLRGRTFMQASPSAGEATFESLLRRECTILTSSVVARRQALLDAGLFDPRFFHSEDFDLWLRVAHRGGRLAYQKKILGSKRSHGSNLTSVPGALLRAQIQICGKLLDRLEMTPAQQELARAHQDWCAACLALETGKRELLAGRYVEAATALSDASRVLGGRKLALSAFGARVAPGLLRRLYQRRSIDTAQFPERATQHE